MTSLLSGPTRPARTAPEPPTDVAHRRPLVLLALLGGVAAAAGPLVVCLGVGVAGWFLSDAGAHGAPRDGLRAGAYAWLMGHGSGLTIAGVTISAIPLGITVICAWAVWRIAHRVGDSVSGHGPDADAIADGVRDWTVPAATALFTAAYVAVAVVTLRVLSADSVPVSGTRVVVWSLLLCVVVGGASIAIGAGRAAIWTAFLPLSVRAAATVCLKVVSTFLLVSAAMFLVALAVDLGAALNVMSELHSDVGEASLYAGLALVVLPNAALCAGSYLLGPGFAVGTATIASPTAVVLGPVPAFPLLAALPDDGAPVVLDGAAPARPTGGGGVRRGARAPPVPDHALGGRGRPRLRRGHPGGPGRRRAVCPGRRLRRTRPDAGRRAVRRPGDPACRGGPRPRRAGRLPAGHLVVPSLRATPGRSLTVS